MLAVFYRLSFKRRPGFLVMRDYHHTELSKHIQVDLDEINLDKILATGQVFRWRKFGNTWFGVIRNKLWILQQSSSGIHYSVEVISEQSDDEIFENPDKELLNYFNLQYKLSDMAKPWLSSDTHLAALLTSHRGLRLIRQDPYECLLSFITSSCNNIPRISSLMLKLSQLSKHSTTVSGTEFHTLPDISVFQRPNTEQQLRTLGFGYRAKYLVSAMQGVCKRGGLEWLESLRNVELGDARKELSELAGVGPKVASCVCLMSLDKHAAVPIDTHIYQVAVKYYGRPNKALTPAVHDSIEQFFQRKHGKFAGWAQGYLFYSNSKKEAKPTKKVDEKSVEESVKNLTANKKSKAKAKKADKISENNENVNDNGLVECLPRTRSKRVRK